MQYESKCGTLGATKYCHQDCYATKTLYETVNGTANDTITAIRNAEYLALVDDKLPLKIFSGLRIYVDRGD